MSHSVHERLRDLEEDVRDLKVQPAAEVRARGRRRGRRQVAALTTAGVVVAGLAVAWVYPRSGPTSEIPVAAGPVVSCVLTLPDDPSAVQIRVLDGGTSVEALDDATAELEKRRFSVLRGAPDADPEGAAALRYGPAAIGAAVLVRAEVHGEVTMRFDPERADEVIDLTIGTGFNRLATSTEINQSLVTVGEPSAPPECSGR